MVGCLRTPLRELYTKLHFLPLPGESGGDSLPDSRNIWKGGGGMALLQHAILCVTDAMSQWKPNRGHCIARIVRFAIDAHYWNQRLRCAIWDCTDGNCILSCIFLHIFCSN